MIEIGPNLRSVLGGIAVIVFLLIVLRGIYKLMLKDLDK